MEQLFEFVTNHYILVSAFVVLLVAVIFVETQRGGKKVSPQEAVNRINRDEAVILDVREKKEYSEGHIGDAVHMPLSALKDRMDELKKEGDKQIIVTDKMGQHSATAVKQLVAAGYQDVVRMNGGIAEWKGANLPLKKKK